MWKRCRWSSAYKWGKLLRWSTLISLSPNRTSYISSFTFPVFFEFYLRRNSPNSAFWCSGKRKLRPRVLPCAHPFWRLFRHNICYYNLHIGNGLLKKTIADRLQQLKSTLSSTPEQQWYRRLRAALKPNRLYKGRSSRECRETRWWCWGSDRFPQFRGWENSMWESYDKLQK